MVNDENFIKTKKHVGKHEKKSEKIKNEKDERVKENIIKNEKNERVKENIIKNEKDEKAKENKIKNDKTKGRKIPKEISQDILKKMFTNLIKAIVITIYFIVLNVAYSSIKEERLINDIKVFAAVFLATGIFYIEKAYKKDESSYAQTGIEFLVLSLHSLSIMHVITQFKYDFRFYLLTSSYIISIYYVLKAIILYTQGRRQYLRSLSDIPDIVKRDEPIKKEAKKRKKDKTEN